MTTRLERPGEPPRLWPPLLVVLGGIILGYVSFMAAAMACLAESIMNFGTTGCAGPLWTTVGMLVAALGVLLGLILLLVRVVMRVRASRERTP